MYCTDSFWLRSQRRILNATCCEFDPRSGQAFVIHVCCSESGRFFCNLLSSIIIFKIYKKSQGCLKNCDHPLTSKIQKKGTWRRLSFFIAPKYMNWQFMVYEIKPGNRLIDTGPLVIRYRFLTLLRYPKDTIAVYRHTKQMQVNATNIFIPRQLC